MEEIGTDLGPVSKGPPQPWVIDIRSYRPKARVPKMLLLVGKNLMVSYSLSPEVLATIN